MKSVACASGASRHINSPHTVAEGSCSLLRLACGGDEVSSVQVSVFRCHICQELSLSAAAVDGGGLTRVAAGRVCADA